MNSDLKQKYGALSAILVELDRRKNLKIYSYNKGAKVHLKQLAFHRSQKRNRWVFGGNRSGKSECGAVEVVWMARGIHPFRQNRKNTEGWVVSPSTRVQKDVAQKKILDYLDPEWIDDIIMLTGKSQAPLYGVIEKIVVKNVFGGKSVIGFKSHEEGREKFQGASLDYVWFDEEPPEDIYSECVMRVVDKKGDVFATMTPLKGRTFVYDKIYLNSANDPELFTIFMQWSDNPYIDAAEVERMTAFMPTEELEARKFGHFIINNEGLVYKNFSPEVHIVEPFPIPPEWQDKLSIDPGLTNPFSCHWYAVDGDGNVFVVAEHYKAGETLDNHIAKIKEISDALNWHRNSFGGIDALIDSASTQSTLASPKSVAELMFERGIYVNTKVNKDLFSGISCVRSYLKNAEGKAKLFIFSCCTNMIREIKGYRFGAGDVPIKRDDHAMDELRYYLTSRPRPARIEEPKTAIQRDKERLYRRLRANRNNY